MGRPELRLERPRVGDRPQAFLIPLVGDLVLGLWLLADALLHEAKSNTLVALGISRTPMGVRQHQLGLHRMPIANGGRAVEVFGSGTPHRAGHLDEDPREPPSLVHGLGIRSEIIVPLVVDQQRRGILLACSSQYDAFSEEALHFLDTVAHWVGVVAHRGVCQPDLARGVVRSLVWCLVAQTNKAPFW